MRHYSDNEESVPAQLERQIKPALDDTDYNPKALRVSATMVAAFCLNEL